VSVSSLKVNPEATIEDDSPRLHDLCTVMGGAAVIQTCVQGVDFDGEVIEATRCLRMLDLPARVGLTLRPQTGQSLASPRSSPSMPTSSGALGPSTARKEAAWLDRHSASSDRHVRRWFRGERRPARLRSRRAMFTSAWCICRIAWGDEVVPVAALAGGEVFPVSLQPAALQLGGSDLGGGIGGHDGEDGVALGHQAAAAQGVAHGPGHRGAQLCRYRVGHRSRRVDHPPKAAVGLPLPAEVFFGLA
jgi:hypothetical protein